MSEQQEQVLSLSLSLVGSIEQFFSHARNMKHERNVRRQQSDKTIRHDTFLNWHGQLCIHPSLKILEWKMFQAGDVRRLLHGAAPLFFWLCTAKAGAEVTFRRV